jgi:hypothetical protein
MGLTRHLLTTGIILIGTVVTTQAQEPEQGQENDAEHGVARISVLAGDVSIQHGDSGERSAAAINAPLVADDRVATGPGARAEIQFDYANVARVAADSEVRLSELAGNRYQLQVGRGTVMFSVVRDSHAQVAVSTPSISLRPLQRGAYRISVFDDGRSEITVRLGEAEIQTPGGVEKLQPGSTMMARGNPSDPEFQVVAAIQQDDFDRWNAERDQNLTRSRSYQHVSPDIYGAEELDQNGRWVQTPEYGSVWTPTVGPDWAPYRNGRWAWVDWYGWTWVSYDPWGWAPFHYGRWFYSAPYGWCWNPGAVYGRHFWSPALVAFFGFGGFHVGVGFGGPGFGWVPLAPYERCYPWWGRGFYGGYRDRNVLVNNIHVVNNVNIVNNYRNARVVNGVTAVNAADFARGRFTNMTRLSTDQLHQASLVRGQVPIAPAASSLRVSDRPTTVTSRSNAYNSGGFSRSQPAAGNRVPFAQQQQSLSQISRTGGASSPGVASQPQANATAQAQTGGWRRLGGESPQSSVAGQARGSVQPSYQPRGGADSSASAGWRRFGAPTQSAPTGNVAPQVNNGGWHTSGDRPATAAPHQSYQQSTGSDGWRRFGQPQSLQIAPPIVRERATPSGGGQRYGGNPGNSGYSGYSSGGGRSTTRTQSAPSSGGGGGGGHSSGGGGGGHSAAPSGGGGGHSGGGSSGSHGGHGR